MLTATVSTSRLKPSRWTDAPDNLALETTEISPAFFMTISPQKTLGSHRPHSAPEILRAVFRQTVHHFISHAKFADQFQHQAQEAKVICYG